MCACGLPFPSPGDLPDLGIKPRSPALQAGSLLFGLGGVAVKNLPVDAGGPGDAGLFPELGISPAEGNGNPLQYGQRNLATYSSWGREELDTTESDLARTHEFISVNAQSCPTLL